MARKLKQSLARYQASKQQEEAKQRKANHASNMKLRQKEAQASRARAAARTDWTPFSDYDRVLLVGEGDFSFAKALILKKDTLNILATVFDSAEEVKEKYPNSAETLEFLDQHGVTVAFEIDATKLSSYKQIQDFSPTKIVFNFPHLGNSVSDVDRNINQHQKLLLAFFTQCQTLKSDVVLTLFTGEPYDSWEFKKLGRAANYVVQRSQAFISSVWEGYSHQLTRKGGARTSVPQKDRSARMYLFTQDTGPKPESTEKSSKESNKEKRRTTRKDK